MKRFCLPVGKYVCAFILLLLLSCASTHAVPLLTDEQTALNVESFDVAWERIRDQHWDKNLGGLDWDKVREKTLPKVKQAKDQEEFIAIMNDMIAPFGQSHFMFISPSVHEAMSGDDMVPNGEGEIGLKVDVVEGLTVVTQIDLGSVAEKAGVQRGWEFVEIDGEKTRRFLRKLEKALKDKPLLSLMRQRALTARLMGRVGSKKKVLFRDGEGNKIEKEMKLAAPKGKMFSMGHMPPMRVTFDSRLLEGDVGYIAFNAFMDPMLIMPAFEKAIGEFQIADGLIVDLRGNPGGIAGMVMGLGGWFVEEQGLFFGTMKTRDTNLKFVLNPRPAPYTGPLAVLVDGSSASCSEIFAQGLHDVCEARVFGSRTAGAALPAMFTQLPNGDFFYFPFADYVAVTGERLEGVGVVPDEVVEHSRKALLAGRDKVLEAAKEWLAKSVKETGDKKGQKRSRSNLRQK